MCFEGCESFEFRRHLHKWVCAFEFWCLILQVLCSKMLSHCFTFSLCVNFEKLERVVTMMIFVYSLTLKQTDFAQHLSYTRSSISTYILKISLCKTRKFRLTTVAVFKTFYKTKKRVLRVWISSFKRIISTWTILSVAKILLTFQYENEFALKNLRAKS